MMQELGWEDLRARKNKTTAEQGYNDVQARLQPHWSPANQYLTLAGVSSRGHQWQFLVPFYTVNAYKGSFFPLRKHAYSI